MEIWKQVAIDDLTRFKYLKESIISMEKEIKDIDTFVLSSGNVGDAVRVQGGGSSIEDKYNNYIVKKDKLLNQIQHNKADYENIKTAIQKLSTNEQTVLHIAYIDRKEKYIDEICQTFNVETAQAYRYANNALQMYIRVRYGE